jgi:hypothetical protein
MCVNSLWGLRRRLPQQGRTLSIPVLTLRGLKNTAQLRTALAGLIDFLQSDDVSFAQLDTARKEANQCIRRFSNPAAVSRAEPYRFPPQEARDLARHAKTIRAFISKARR